MRRVDKEYSTGRAADEHWRVTLEGAVVGMEGDEGRPVRLYTGKAAVRTQGREK